MGETLQSTNDLLTGLLARESFREHLERARQLRAAAPQAAAAYTPPATPAQCDDGELQSAVDHCPYCQGVGYVALDVPVTDARFGKLLPCEHCAPYADELCTRQRRRDLMKKLDGRLERYSMLKGDLRTRTFRNFERDRAPEAYTAVRSWAAGVLKRNLAHPWLFLHGPVGNGKTHLAAAAANGLRGQGEAVIFSTLPQLLGMAAEDTFKYKEDVVYVLQRAPSLIIDDVRAEDLGTDWARTLLFRVLDHRYVTRSVTLVVSNLPLDDGGRGVDCLRDYEPRLASRLGDPQVGRVVVNTAPSWRV